MAKFIIIVFLALFGGYPTPLWAEMIFDASGRKVAVPDKINSIVALGGSMAFVTYLDAQNLVIGVEAIDQANNISKPYIIVNKEKFKNTPVVGSGGSMRLHNVEAIIRLKPDLVCLLARDPHEADLLQEKIRRPVVTFSYGRTIFDEKIYLDSILLAGKLFNRMDKALKLTNYLRSCPDELSFRPKGNELSAYVGGLSAQGSRDLTSTTSNSWPMKMAGVKNVIDESYHKGQFFLNKEHLLAINPPIMFIDANGLPLIRESVKKEPNYFARLKAFQNDKVWRLVPHTSYMSNPENLYVNGYFMAKAVYPNAYKDLDPVAKAEEIYVNFFGRSIYSYYSEIDSDFGKLNLRDSSIIFEKYINNNL